MPSFESNRLLSEALDRSELVREISNEMHRVAQPLTVLHGLLEQALLDAHTAGKEPELLGSLMEQAQRLMSSFDHVRQLVHLQESASGFADHSAKGIGRAAPQSSRRATFKKMEHSHV